MNEVIVKTSKVTEATVFLSGAFVTRTAVVALEQGASKVVFSDLPSDAQPLSLNISVEGISLLSAVYRVNYLKDATQEPKIADLDKKLKKIDDDLALIKEQIAVLDMEREMLIANRKLGGKKAGLKLEYIKSAVEFFRSRMDENRKEVLVLRKNPKKEKQLQKTVKYAVAYPTGIKITLE